MVSSNAIDGMIEKAVFDKDGQVRAGQRQQIRDTAAAQGIYPASIQGLYEAAGQGHYANKTVPAINIRGLTYLTARAIFRMALKYKVGAFILEIARSEIGYTEQAPDEYTVSLLAAAIKEGYKGPVFIQGDHFQLNRGKYTTDPKSEYASIEKITREAVEADFLNIDIDASTLVDLGRPTVDQQQENNYAVTTDLTKLIRGIEPENTTISVGGEIGEVGKTNTTPEELRAFMKGYKAQLGEGTTGISKMSVQTGTTHGGVVMADGSIADVKLDFEAIKELSKVAKQEFGVGGIVQHGASTLPDEMFEMFPETDTLEIHLATGFQNIIYDSPSFPKDLLDKIYRHLAENHADEKSAGDTDEQFYYKTRKRGWGPFKQETWQLPEDSQQAISSALESQFTLLFQRLNVENTVELVNKYTK